MRISQQGPGVQPWWRSGSEAVNLQHTISTVSFYGVLLYYCKYIKLIFITYLANVDTFLVEI